METIERIQWTAHLDHDGQTVINATSIGALEVVGKWLDDGIAITGMQWETNVVSDPMSRGASLVFAIIHSYRKEIAGTLRTEGPKGYGGETGLDSLWDLIDEVISEALADLARRSIRAL